MIINYKAVSRGYDFVQQNQKVYPTKLVKQILLLGSFCLPKKPRSVQYVGAHSDHGIYVPLSKEQYKSFQKLRDLIHNVKAENLKTDE